MQTRTTHLTQRFTFVFLSLCSTAAAAPILTVSEQGSAQEIERRTGMGTNLRRAGVCARQKAERLVALLADIEKLRQAFHELALDASLANAKIMEVAVASRALGVTAALKDEKLVDAAARETKRCTMVWTRSRPRLPPK